MATFIQNLCVCLYIWQPCTKVDMATFIQNLCVCLHKYIGPTIAFVNFYEPNITYLVDICHLVYSWTFIRTLAVILRALDSYITLCIHKQPDFLNIIIVTVYTNVLFFKAT